MKEEGRSSLSLHLSPSISPSGDRLMDASIGILLEQAVVVWVEDQTNPACWTTGLVLTHWHSSFLDVRVLGQCYTTIDRPFISSSFFGFDFF